MNEIATPGQFRLSMNNPSLSAALEEIIAAYKRPEKAHFTVRLRDQELAVLKKTAKGRSASAALEQIVAAYMESEKRPECRDKSVKKASFIINATLLQEVQQMANETKTTASAIIHAALLEADKSRPPLTERYNAVEHAAMWRPD